MVSRKDKTVIAMIVVVLFFVQNCAGRAAHPVKVSESGDGKKTCNELRHETRKHRKSLKKMIPDIKAADKKRTLLMISGGLLIIPWFFLDLTDADKVEANARRARHNYLIDVAKKNNCRFKAPHLKSFYFHDKGYKTRNR
jgi:hypothetical protein